MRSQSCHVLARSQSDKRRFSADSSLSGSTDSEKPGFSQIAFQGFILVHEVVAQRRTEQPFVLSSLCGRRQDQADPCHLVDHLQGIQRLSQSGTVSLGAPGA